jgi:hypothetical protein
MAVRTRGWAQRVAMALLAIASVYVAESPRSQSARRLDLGEGAGRPRAVAFTPEGGLLAANTLDGAIQLYRIDPPLDRAVPWGLALRGFTAAFSPDGARLAVGGDSTLSLWETATAEHRRTVRTDTGWTSAPGVQS